MNKEILKIIDSCEEIYSYKSVSDKKPIIMINKIDLINKIKKEEINNGN